MGWRLKMAFTEHTEKYLKNSFEFLEYFSVRTMIGGEQI